MVSNSDWTTAVLRGHIRCELRCALIGIAWGTVIVLAVVGGVAVGKMLRVIG